MHLKLSALERQIELQKQAEDHIRRARHDLRHNCTVAIGENRQRGWCWGLWIFCANSPTTSTPTPSDSTARITRLTAFFRAFAERAVSEGICVEIKANIPPRLTVIDEVELASLFANAFENAIEGCLSAAVEAPFIRISAECSDGRVLLSYKNSCGKGGVFRSSAAQQETRGRHRNPKHPIHRRKVSRHGEL